ncbi:hypothetical protein RHMOL_Rhmol04G0224100 [Rhododendron molle]|uniref:Uncharacterized protein n=1 Tax=Rhododendron molle TaxID=49168 RepID=A0ACC0P4Y3_RHOML|nr:hypothetical protein RHMOL_Rhmol04G0224100 [Rhododendron molle]
MVEVEDPHPNETTLGLSPFGDPNLASSRASALGKAHMSIGFGAGTSTQDAWAATELHTYICHLERKIDDLSTVVERDKHVRDELAEIKHLLQISTSHSSGSHGGRRSRHSPPRSCEGGCLVEHQSRPSTKDCLEPPVGIGKGHREPTPSFTKVANDEDGLLEFQTKGYRERLKNARAKSPFVSHPKEKGDGSQVTERLEPYTRDSYRKDQYERSPQTSRSIPPKRKEYKRLDELIPQKCPAIECLDIPGCSIQPHRDA